MLLDQHNPFFHRIRHQGTVAVTSIQSVFDDVGQWLDNASGMLRSRRQLLLDNRQLHRQQFLLQGRLQQLIALQAENKQLRALLHAPPRAKLNLSVAQVIRVSPTPFLQRITIDQGRQGNGKDNKSNKRSVFIGQAVLDNQGIMGQVIAVGRTSSTVMLITDRNSAIPIEDSRSGLRAIARGDGLSNTLSVQDVVETADIKVGDLMLSSGLGQRYPQGYPVAKVININRHSSTPFMVISLQPLAHLHRERFVLLVWPQNEPQQKSTNKSLDKDAEP